MMATTMPISPARTPRRAVRGWLSHLSDSTKSAAATRYEPQTAMESAPVACEASAACASKPSELRDGKTLFTAGRLPAKHLEHAIGDPEAAHDVRHRRDHSERPQHG